MTAQFDLSPVNNPAALFLGIPILLLFGFLGYTALAFSRETSANQRHDVRIVRAMEVAGVDNMSMQDFRTFVQQLMEHQGYITELPRVVVGADDIGTDLIASKDGKRYSVYVMRYAKALSPRAVSEARRNMEPYGCDAAMVVTNGTLREEARKLAVETGVVVIERAELAEWIFARQPQIEALV